MKRDSLFRRERGSVTVLTVTILLFGAILALVFVDLLRALESKARAQTAADAAALAAAQELARPTGAKPSEMAAHYARRNGATLIECRCDADTSSAVVAVEVPVDVLFLSAARDARGRAKAVVERSGAA